MVKLESTYATQSPKERAEHIEKAEKVRRGMMEKVLPLIKSGNTIPQLTDEQTQKIVEKIEYLCSNEYRASFYTSLWYLAEPTLIDGKYRLTPTLEKWAGYRKIKEQPEKYKKIGESANGRVIRSTRVW